MKRTLALLIALMMLLLLTSAGAVEESTEALKEGFIAEYESMCDQEQLINLEMQILQLELQRAQLMQDESEVSRLNAEIALHTQTLATMAIQKEDAAAAIVSAILIQQEELNAEIDALQSALHEAQAQLAAVQMDYTRFYAESARAQSRQSVQWIFRSAAAFESVATGSDTVLYKAMDENGQQIGWCVKASAAGYAGPVAVTFAVDMEGCVTNVNIGDSRFVEIPGFGLQWIATKHRSQFKDLNVATGGVIEAITGATVTSNAVLSATNVALECIAKASGTEVESPVQFGHLPTENEKALQTLQQADDVLSATRKGFQSNVTVYVQLDEDGCIATLAIDTSGETKGFGTRVAEDTAFISQFIGAGVPMPTYDCVDAVSGATVTSRAVIDAINDVLTHAADGTAAATPESAFQQAAAQEGALTASAKGLLSDVKVTITLNGDGTIATIAVDASGEYEYIAAPCTGEAFLSQFIGRRGPFLIGEDVDVVSGATYTSTAVIDALNQLFPTD